MYRIKKSVPDRAELRNLIGDSVQFVCPKCSHKEISSINDVKAKESSVIAIAAFLIMVFGTGLIGYLLKDYLFRPNNPYNILAIGGLLLIPSIIFMILNKQERDNVRRFNQYRIN